MGEYKPFKKSYEIRNELKFFEASPERVKIKNKK